MSGSPSTLMNPSYPNRRMLNGLKVFPARRFDDERGFFTELYNEFLPSLPDELKGNVGQVNVSYSVKGTVRGMHYQLDPPMGKFFRLIKGSILLIEIDIRKNSPTYGEMETLYITDNHPYTVWIPFGFANGFMALEDSLIGYACTGHYNPSTERAINPLSANVKLHWEEAHRQFIGGEPNFIISKKDNEAPMLDKEKIFPYIEL
jgi:dTDP-4-dehydrorhamnose 3,5-epimerase